MIGPMLCLCRGRGVGDGGRGQPPGTRFSSSWLISAVALDSHMKLAAFWWDLSPQVFAGLLTKATSLLMASGGSDGSVNDRALACVQLRRYSTHAFNFDLCQTIDPCYLLRSHYRYLVVALVWGVRRAWSWDSERTGVVVGAVLESVCGGTTTHSGYCSAAQAPLVVPLERSHAVRQGVACCAPRVVCAFACAGTRCAGATEALGAVPLWRRPLVVLGVSKASPDSRGPRPPST
jgi:hypothetical protein